MKRSLPADGDAIQSGRMFLTGDVKERPPPNTPTLAREEFNAQSNSKEQT
jgi:hypothetical protein